MNREQLIDAIMAAFPTYPIPEEKTILYSGALQDEQEMVEIRQFFANRKWNEITPHDIFNFRLALSFFSDAAMAYYLPAYLLCSLQDEQGVDTAVEDVVFALGHSNPNIWTSVQTNILKQWITYFEPSLLDQSVKKAIAKLTNNLE